jgi:hypothetical protein
LRVTSSRAVASDSEGPQPIEHYESEQLYDSGAFSVDEFIDNLPPAEGGSEVLVLIDGQPAYIDPASLPLSMIAGIEVSRDGSMPEHGAYANGQVINIRTKKDYRGGELGAKIRGTFEGGGSQQDFKLSGMTTRGKLRAFVSVDQREAHALAATQREFSREQDHTARGGSDLRLAWGHPAVVQAVSGNLNGFPDATGLPTNVALVPENQSGIALSPVHFIPRNPSLPSVASNQRRFNAAAYRMLVAPSRRTGGNLSFTYALAERIQISLTASYTATRSDRIGPPPVTPASADTVVPAEFNPFGQDVEVGLVHLEFGPVRQSTRANTGQIGLKFNGRIGETWRWNGGIAYRRGETRQSATDLDREKFSASLASGDSAQRFNPFGDARAGPINSHLYPALTLLRTRADSNRDTRLDLATNGQLTEIWGGPARLSVRGNASDRRQDRVNSHPTLGLPPNSRQRRTSASLSGSLSLPLVGQPNARRFVRRLDAQLSTRISQQDDEGAGRDASVGLVWVPVKPLALRAKYSANTTSPPRSIVAGSETLVSETLIDPARGGVTVSNVEIFNRDTVTAEPARTERESVGATLEPPFLKGLRISASYDVRRRHNILRDTFDAQEIVNNEVAFPGRVVRAPLDPTDPSSGAPGRIVGVDITPGNSGEALTRDFDFSLEYRLPWQQFGRFRVTAFAQRVLESRYEIAPGVPYVHEGVSDLNPPDWTFQSLASWNRAGWNVSTRMRYTGPVLAGPESGSGVPAITIFDVNAGYRFQRPLWKKFGRGLRVAVGIENVFDRPPPFADTLSGYRSGSPLGRTYTCAVTVPL